MSLLINPLEMNFQKCQSTDLYFKYGHIGILSKLLKKVKYVYQELPNSEETSSPHGQEEKEGAWLLK
jgi:hypothetical protein